MTTSHVDENQAPMGRATYTADEVRQILGIGRNTVYEGMRTGEIPSIKVGRRCLVPRAWLDELISGTTAEAAS